jgi:hypothetical protein
MSDGHVGDVVMLELKPERQRCSRSSGLAYIHTGVERYHALIRDET